MRLIAPRNIMKHFREAYDRSQNILKDSQGPNVFSRAANVQMAQGPISISRSSFNNMPLPYKSVDYTDEVSDVLQRAIIAQMIFAGYLRPIDGGELYKGFVSNKILEGMTLNDPQVVIEAKAFECARILKKLRVTHRPEI